MADSEIYRSQLMPTNNVGGGFNYQNFRAPQANTGELVEEGLSAASSLAADYLKEMDETAVLDAGTKLSNEYARLLYDKDNGFMSKRGLAAVSKDKITGDAPVDTMLKQFGDFYNKLSSGLTDNQRRELQKVYSDQSVRMYGAGMQHAVEQQTIYQTSVANGFLDSAVDRSASVYNRPDELKKLELSIDRGAALLAKSTGRSAKEIKRQAMSRLHASVANGYLMAAKENPEMYPEAEKYIKEHAVSLGADNFVRMSSAVESGIRNYAISVELQNVREYYTQASRTRETLGGLYVPGDNKRNNEVQTAFLSALADKDIGGDADTAVRAIAIGIDRYKSVVNNVDGTESFTNAEEKKMEEAVALYRKGHDSSQPPDPFSWELAESLASRNLRYGNDDSFRSDVASRAAAQYNIAQKEYSDKTSRAFVLCRDAMINNEDYHNLDEFKMLTRYQQISIEDYDKKIHRDDPTGDWDLYRRITDPSYNGFAGMDRATFLETIKPRLPRATWAEVQKLYDAYQQQTAMIGKNQSLSDKGFDVTYRANVTPTKIASIIKALDNDFAKRDLQDRMMIANVFRAKIGEDVALGRVPPDLFKDDAYLTEYIRSMSDQMVMKNNFYGALVSPAKILNLKRGDFQFLRNPFGNPDTPLRVIEGLIKAVNPSGDPKDDAATRAVVWRLLNMNNVYGVVYGEPDGEKKLERRKAAVKRVVDDNFDEMLRTPNFIRFMSQTPVCRGSDGGSLTGRALTQAIENVKRKNPQLIAQVYMYSLCAVDRDESAPSAQETVPWNF